jgi:tetraacyldisaccharide 4'-kinase
MYEPPRYIAPALWLPGLLYGAVVACRNRLYASGVFRTRRLGSPVISVGNITLGGSGKTPLVIHIAEVVLSLGGTPVLLSRGYGRRAPGFLRVLGPTEAASTSDLGDEPALIRRRCHGIWLAIDPDRYRAARAVEARVAKPVFILDDGFQHRALHRDFDVVIVDATQPLGDNRLFPAGTLREPPSALRRADAVVLNGRAGPALAARWIGPRTMVFACTQSISHAIPYDAWRSGSPAAPDPQPRCPFFLLAAIGNPERFRRDAATAGFEVRGARFFRDHHRLSPGDWSSCRSAAMKAGAAAILTTEKDAVKIEGMPEFPVCVAVQKTAMVDSSGFEATLEKIVGMRA